MLVITDYNGRDASVLDTPTRPIHETVGGRHAMPTQDPSILEVWRPVSEFPDYEVSDFGNVRRAMASAHRPSLYPKHRPLRQTLLRDYAYVDLRAHRRLVHRLVALAFLTPDAARTCVNHINGVKSDNRAVNLEWVTYSENMLHAHRTGLFKQQDGGTKPVPAVIAEIRNLRAAGWTYQRLHERFGFAKSHLSGIVKGDHWKRS